MKVADSPFLTDLLANSLRWLVLLGLCISLGAGGAFLQGGQDAARLPLTILALGLAALWNGFVSTLSIFNRRLPYHRQVNLALDILFGLALFIISGGISGNVPWAALLPVLTGAVYFGIHGSFAAAVIMSFTQAVYTLLAAGSTSQFVPVGILTGLNLAGALIVALLNEPLIHHLHENFLSTINKRKEGERKAQQLERERMQALFEMIKTFSSTLNYQTVLETTLETAIFALDGSSGAADEMVGAVLLFGRQNMLQITATSHFHVTDLAVSVPGNQGVLHEALMRGEAQLIEQPGDDPELCQFATMQGQKAGLCLPLIHGMNAFGVMLFGHPRHNFFSADRVDALQMLGNQAVIALQNARLYQDLSHEKERILQTQEEAQNKLARDLHDGPIQSLSAIAMRIGVVRRLLERSPNDAAAELVRIESLARHTTQEMRHMLFTLRPLVLESEGLVAALATMAEKMDDLYQQKIHLQIAPEVVQQLDSNRQTVVFYMTEEAVTNARKHASATEIEVRLENVPNMADVAMLEISDNGVGFDVGQVNNAYDRRGSLGMINLRERAEQINGLLKIDSTPGSGTRVRVFIPLNGTSSVWLNQRQQAAAPALR